MSENKKRYLRRLFHIQVRARLECQSDDKEQIMNTESFLFLEEFGLTRKFGEPTFIDRMRSFYRDVLEADENIYGNEKSALA